MPTLGQELRRNPDVWALLVLWLLLGLGGVAGPRPASPAGMPVPTESGPYWKSPVRSALDIIRQKIERSSQGDCLMRLEF
jgi:hypothetical protein